MRLADYLGPDVVAKLNKPATLPFIDRFVFGEQYRIEMGGTVHVLPDLELVLGIMREEFAATPGFHPSVVIGDVDAPGPGAAGKLGNAGRRVLFVAAVEDSNFLSPPPGMLGNMIEQIRAAVTLYNLTGSWDQFNTGNL